ncbi:MAG: OadG family protein [Proteobacteria bacterium]|nr:OadG family protein [Pseudomonadota bacterium]
MESFNVQNIATGNGIAISITGMSIVFFGLLLISIYVALLPKIVLFLSEVRLKPKTPEEKEVENDKTAKAAKQPEEIDVAALKEWEETDIASVIGLVLHLETERFYQTSNERITIARNPVQSAGWNATGKMRDMPLRRNHA